MEDLADYALSLTPMQRQQMLAQLMRTRARNGDEEALAAANQRGHGLDMTAVAALMGNNPEMAQAAQLAMKNQQSQYKPVQMGQMGFMLPNSGSFIESPMYQDEKAAGRQATRDNTQARIEMQRMALDQQEQNNQANRLLRLTLGQQAEEGRNARAQDRADLQQALLAMRLGQVGDRNADRKDQQTNKNIQTFSNSLEKAGIPEFENALSLVEQNLKKYPAGELPGIGRMAGYVPSQLSSSEVQGVRADVQQAANILLRSRSGQAVTDSEMRRFLQEVAMGGGMDEATFRRGWANVRRTFEEKKANLLASVDPQTLGEYNSRAGTDYQQGRRPTAPAGGKTRIKYDSNGNELP